MTAIVIMALSDYPQTFQLTEVQASPQSDCIVPNCQHPGTTRLLGAYNQVETHAGSWRRLLFKLTIKETIAQAQKKIHTLASWGRVSLLAADKDAVGIQPSPVSQSRFGPTAHQSPAQTELMRFINSRFWWIQANKSVSQWWLDLDR